MSTYQHAMFPAPKANAFGPRKLTYGTNAKAALGSSTGQTDDTSDNALARQCMLVSLTVSVWQGRKLDRAATRTTAAHYNADAQQAGQYNKSLVPAREMTRITRAASALRAVNYNLTLPWLDGGLRVLSGKAYFRYQQEISQHVKELETAADDFAARYPAIVAAGPRILGGMFRAADYPTPGDIRSRFGATVNFLPFPTSSDFRVAGINEHADEIKTTIDQLADRVSQTAATEIHDRATEVLTKIVDRLSAYTVEPDGSIKNPFRDSLVSNVRDLVDLLPLLNVTDSPAVDELRASLATLATPDADAFRSDASLRAATVATAEDIMARMADFV